MNVALASSTRRGPRMLDRYRSRRELLLRFAKLIRELTAPLVWTPKEERVAARGKAHKKYVQHLTRALRDQPGALPTRAELRAMALFGQSTRGQYAHSFRVLTDFIGPENARLFVAANAILSPQSAWEEHSRGAMRALRLWIDAGRPTGVKNKRAIGRLMASLADERTHDERRLYSLLDNVKVRKLTDLFAHPEKYAADLNQIAASGWGKITDFGGAFIEPHKAPIDTHQGKLTTPGLEEVRSQIRLKTDAEMSPEERREARAAHRENLAAFASAKELAREGVSEDVPVSQRLARAIADKYPGTGLSAALLAAQKRLISKKPLYKAYKALVGQVAHELGWEQREAQEAGWTGVVATIAARNLGIPVHEILGKIRHEDAFHAWNVGHLLTRPELLGDVEPLGLPGGHVRDFVSEAGKGPAASGEPTGIDRGAFASAALRVPAVEQRGAWTAVQDAHTARVAQEALPKTPRPYSRGLNALEDEFDIYATRLGPSRRALVRYAGGAFGVRAGQLLDHPAALPESMLGSKLALVLHEIARSDLARKDAKLRRLADHALAGYSSLDGKDVYVAIRDHLLSRRGVKVGGYDRAEKLATLFNWHKVSGALDFDRVLAKWVKSRAVDREAVERGEAFRHTAHVYGHGYEANVRKYADAPTLEHRERVLEAMRSHVARELKGYVPAAEFTRDAVLRSLNRLAWGEHARESLTAHAEVSPKVPITKPDPPQPAYHPTTRGPRINPRRYPEQFARRPPEVDYGIVHASHDKHGRFDPDGTAGVLAERSAVLHAANVLGLVPPRSRGESPEQYSARTSVIAAGMTEALRDHVRDNPFSPQVLEYIDRAKQIAAPRDELDPTGRIELPDATVSTLGLSAAVAPLVARIASTRGHVVGRYPAPGDMRPARPRRVRAELVPEPVRPLPGGPIDLTDHPDVDDYAADLFRADDRSREMRALWGSGKNPAVEPPERPESDFDFALPEVPGLPTWTGATLAVQKAPTKPRKPEMTAATRRAVYRTIAEHLDGMGHVDPKTGDHVLPEESVVAHVQARHGLAKRAATAAVAAYHKAHGSAAATPPASAPTNRVWPPVPRRNRLSRRSLVRYVRGRASRP